jgi:hypothetical protein
VGEKFSSLVGPKEKGECSYITFTRREIHSPFPKVFLTKGTIALGARV